ncbi:MAG: hypothetical protein DRN12_03990 [Thermoplasmata archaeon]|nr:MAG: hypothetical protein DRN12_03990 [Thermoplasmata archaeon]HEC89503.1 hypothetical protein [Thermoplasmatales archaeon]
MKGTNKKKLIIGVAALFISLAYMPMVIGAPMEKENKTTIRYGILNSDGTFEQQSVTLSERELTDLISKLTRLINLLQTFNGDWSIIDSLLKGHPLLQKLLQYLLSSDVLGNKKIVASFGLGRSFNPFKELKTSIMRPFTFWHYSNTVVSEQIPIPSTTVILDLNPFKISTFKGFQIGFMLKFRGFYIYIPRQLPEQSITLFIGVTPSVWAFALPEMPTPPQGS